MTEVTIRYYSRHLLLTVDLNLLFVRLASELPDVNRVIIEGMAEEEKATSAQTTQDGIIMVRERIHIYFDDGRNHRRRDLEIEIERNSLH